jgi:hypothetical protein
LKDFHSSPDHYRGFCSACGSTLYWREHGPSGEVQELGILSGTLDEEVLLGKEGKLLCEPKGGQFWCCNFIDGITDKYSLVRPRWKEGLKLGVQVD